MQAKYFYILLFLFVGFLTLIVVALSRQGAISPALSPTPTPLVQATSVPSAQPTTQTRPPVLYDTDATDGLIDRAKNRRELSASDTAVKQNFLNRTNNATGTLYQTPTIIIRYVKAPNDIEVEIKTQNISSAKQEALTWLASQGLSREGICNFPVMFYLNFQIREQLRGSQMTFNPAPDNCE